MATSSTRRPIGAWLAACLLAVPMSVLAQSRGIAPVEGFSAPASPAAAVNAGGNGRGSSVVSPISFSAPSLSAAPSAPVGLDLRSRPARRGLPRARRLRRRARLRGRVGSFVPSAANSAPAAVSRRAGVRRPAARRRLHRGRPLSPFRRIRLVRAADAGAQSAREAAAVATVEGGIADWTARADQTLDAAPVLAAASGRHRAARARVAAGLGLRPGAGNAGSRRAVQVQDRS